MYTIRRYIGLDWIGLDWIGLDWIGLDCKLDTIYLPLKHFELGCRRQHITHEILEKTRKKFRYFRVFSWATLKFLYMNLTANAK